MYMLKYIDTDLNTLLDISPNYVCISRNKDINRILRNLNMSML